ncbi:putative IgA Peptidase M64 [Trypanosoma cruzi]|uniref:Putative IgA Peptidase M64 n=1 Tax=Trypanosoma cruzi TaxID=5693 RepID=A0A2V2VVV1_TRYCR|nr:putative IgA Peptidase M64 [Trypanosoma cruzi]
MSLFFPHFITSRMDPRQLTPEETQEVQGVFELQNCQYQKFCRFATASGALSPETLFKLFLFYTSDHFTVDESEFISLIKAEAETNCPDASMCRGLTAFELEGLRHVWTALNPRILGDLNDEQIALFYQWTHSEPLSGDSHFQEWKNSPRRASARQYWVGRILLSFCTACSFMEGTSVSEQYGKGGST